MSEPAIKHMRLMIWIGLTLILTFTGPFGTHERMSFPMLAISWGATVSFAMLFVPWLRGYIYSALGKQRFVVRELASLVVFSVAATPVFWAVFKGGVSGAEWQDVPVFSLQIFVIAVSVSLIRHSVEAALRPARAEEPAKAADTRSKLLQRIGVDGAVGILAISADDHYVSVLLSNGRRERLLMRMGDAVAEADGLEGVQIHRSHWVVRSALVAVGPVQGRNHVWLSDGSCLPVSRSGREAIGHLDLPERITPAVQPDIAAQ